MTVRHESRTDSALATNDTPSSCSSGSEDRGLRWPRRRRHQRDSETTEVFLTAVSLDGQRIVQLNAVDKDWAESRCGYVHPYSLR